MTTLNKQASYILRKYEIHACTDVTGFSFLGHLHEMLDGRLSAIVYADCVPRIREALDYADDFMITAAGQRNRNYVGSNVRFDSISFAMQELLFDPQTSGGLLIAAAADDADAIWTELYAEHLPARIVGEVTEKNDPEILVVR